MTTTSQIQEALETEYLSGIAYFAKRMKVSELTIPVSSEFITSACKVYPVVGGKQEIMVTLDVHNVHVNLINEASYSQ